MLVEITPTPTLDHVSFSVHIVRAILLAAGTAHNL